MTCSTLRRSLIILALVGCGSGNGSPPGGFADAGLVAGECAFCFFAPVPAGDHLMGCNDVVETDCDQHPDALPLRTVTLTEPFELHIREVMQTQYELCVRDGACTLPSANYDPQLPDVPVAADFLRGPPVTNVTHDQARSYCAWIGAGLPTEAQWERAARGSDGTSYQGTNSPPSCDQAVFADCGATEPATTENRGLSFDDIAGNAAEWVADVYAADTYQVSPTIDPTGPSSGTSHVIRGGSYLDDATGLRAWLRDESATEADHIGFRCARNLTE